MVYVKMTTTNVSQRHLKTWRHVRHFSPTKSAYFDGRATVRRLVKCRNPRIVAPFAVKMWHVHRIAAHSTKSATIPYPDASCTNYKSVAQFLIKKRLTNFTNCCVLLTYTVCVYIRITLAIYLTPISPFPTCTYTHTHMLTHARTHPHTQKHVHTTSLHKYM